MPIEQNLDDLVKHAEDFEERRGFTFTVLDPTETDVDRLPLHLPRNAPPTRSRPAPRVLPGSARGSRESRAELDVVLWRTVSDWLATTWPFTTVEYAPR